MENRRMTYNNNLINKKEEHLCRKNWLITLFWSWLGY